MLDKIEIRKRKASIKFCEHWQMFINGKEISEGYIVYEGWNGYSIGIDSKSYTRQSLFPTLSEAKYQVIQNYYWTEKLRLDKKKKIR